VTDYDSNDDSNSDAGALPYQFGPVVGPQNGERNRDSDPEDTENNNDRTQLWTVSFTILFISCVEKSTYVYRKRSLEIVFSERLYVYR
jgi:hypothetical protein